MRKPVVLITGAGGEIGHGLIARITGSGRQSVVALDLNPLEPALGATMGASLGFMLPVSTPCNAIVYGSGHIPLGKMIRYGALLDVIGVVVIIVFVHFLVPLIR